MLPHGVCFPAGPDRYLGVLRREGAARTTYGSVISSRRILEEAGEVAEADRLHAHTGVANLRREAALAADAAQDPSKAKTDQAPAYPLRLLAALEGAVGCPSLPRDHRGYAWFALLRHWSSLR